MHVHCENKGNLILNGVRELSHTTICHCLQDASKKQLALHLSRRWKDFSSFPSNRLANEKPPLPAKKKRPPPPNFLLFTVKEDSFYCVF